MAKKKQSSQSVRQSAKRREEELRQRRNSRIRSVAIIVVIVLAVAAFAFFILNPTEDSDSDLAQDVSGDLVEDPGGDLAEEPSGDSAEGASGDTTGDENSSPATGELPEPGPLAEIEPAERFGYYERPPEMELDPEKEYEALIRTQKGDIRLKLFAEEAPVTVNNFVYLAGQGFYDGTVFHRVIENFMAQGGDPTGTGAGGPGYQFEDEVDTGLTFDRPGLLAMANSGPSTNGSQFFITYVPTPHLDGLHTIFGEIVEGEDVLNSLAFVQPGASATPQGDLIERIVIIER